MSISPVSAYCLNLYELLQFSIPAQRYGMRMILISPFGVFLKDLRFFWVGQVHMKKFGISMWDEQIFHENGSVYFVWVLHLVHFGCTHWQTVVRGRKAAPPSCVEPSHSSSQLTYRIHKYTNTKVHKYTNTQIHKYKFKAVPLSCAEPTHYLNC